MISRSDIVAWRAQAPWPLNEQVEQDLVIGRALVEIYSDPFLRERLAFRGGTALHKLLLKPAARYSEDIDLVQLMAEPIGPVIDRIRERLAFLGKANVKQGDKMTTIIYRFESEIPPVVKMKLKVEINCREHFAVLGYKSVPLEVASNWFSGGCELLTFGLEELLATKMRALYQRKQGRDLFDLYRAITEINVDITTLVSVFNKYMEQEGHPVTQADYIANVEAKIKDGEFRGDLTSLLRADVEFDFDKAWENLNKGLFSKLI